MVYLTSQISETENQTEDNYLFITPPHREMSLDVSQLVMSVFRWGRAQEVVWETQQG